MGITMDNAAAMLLLFGDGDDVITGLLEVNAEGTEYGVAAFLGMEAADAMTAYNLDPTHLRCPRNVGWWMDDRCIFSSNDSSWW